MDRKAPRQSAKLQPGVEVRERLRRVGLKPTLPRMAVLEVIRTAASRHLSAEDIYRGLLGSDREQALATIYRSLSQLEQAGLVSRGALDAGRAMFELNDRPAHGHLVCLRCGRVEEFDTAFMAKQWERVAAKFGYTLTTQPLTLYGHCFGCNDRMRTPSP